LQFNLPKPLENNMDLNLLDGPFPSIARLRLILKPLENIDVPVQQYGMFYAMLCDAMSRNEGARRAIPDGVLLEAPDRGRHKAGPELPLVLGLNALGYDISECHMKLDQVLKGLRDLGRHPARRQILKNFDVVLIEDLITGCPIKSVASAQPITPEKIQQQIARVRSARQIRLYLQSPHRILRSRAAQIDGHRFMDRDGLEIEVLIKSIFRRLAGLGKDVSGISTTTTARLVDKRLEWLDVGYGVGPNRKTLGGCVGIVEIGDIDEVAANFLTIGQYLHVGENTRFGFGKYRILELEEDDWPCWRHHSYLHEAFQPAAIADVANEFNIESGELSATAETIVRGSFTPQSCVKIEIEKPGGGTRVLSIPTRRDRAVQRLILEPVAAAINGFLEDSAVAYRHGLGREDAARKIQRAYRDGFGWAVRADFLTFFDSVNHRLLEDRLTAYLDDPPTIQLIMQFIIAGSPFTGRGLPTGAPLSPVLSNMFLDHFDEQILATGARLVRYADDFVILCRTREAAEHLYSVAAVEAAALKLKLNGDKSGIIDIADGFDFLGFRFSVRTSQSFDPWDCEPTTQPQPVGELGWNSARKSNSEQFPDQPLPGESERELNVAPQVMIVGPEIHRIERTLRNLCFHSQTGSRTVRARHEEVEQIVIVGGARFDWAELNQLVRDGVAVQVLNEWGRIEMEILPTATDPESGAIRGQLALADDPDRSLNVARQLIHSKIVNHAVLAQRYHERERRIPKKLFEAAQEAARAPSIESLLGIEGSAAAIWYSRFGTLLGKDFQFERRVSPDASDPVNVLLNIAHTILYRLIGGMLHANRLIPTVGVLHQARAGHATLASDLQEPFRHLMERAVIDITKKIRATDFVFDKDGPYELKILPRALQRFIALIHRLLTIPVQGQNQSEPHAYRRQIYLLARSYKLHCLDPTTPLRVFIHPHG
ncbi:MAG: CRISPR-associated endonuclease Cas1, partial [Pirellulaceae bacterium]